jgi:hypothetical protein
MNYADPTNTEKRQARCAGRREPKDHPWLPLPSGAGAMWAAWS